MLGLTVCSARKNLFNNQKESNLWIYILRNHGIVMNCFDFTIFQCDQWKCLIVLLKHIAWFFFLQDSSKFVFRNCVYLELSLAGMEFVILYHKNWPISISKTHLVLVSFHPCDHNSPYHPRSQLELNIFNMKSWASVQKWRPL